MQSDDIERYSDEALKIINSADKKIMLDTINELEKISPWQAVSIEETIKIEIKKDNSPVSNGDLKVNEIISNKIKEGKTEEQIYNYLKDQYGEWIVYDPEFNKKNLVLWLFPLILFTFGGLLIYRKVFIN